MKAVLPVTLAITLCAATVWAQQPARTSPAWKQQFLRARQVWQKGEFDRALVVLERAYALAPDNLARAQIAFRYADWSHQLGKYAAARRWYERCLALAPPGSDLIRRAREGLSNLPPVPPARTAIPPPAMPPFTTVPPPTVSVQWLTPTAVAFLVLLLGLLLVLQGASGWKREAFFAQVMLSTLFAAGVSMMLPLGALLMTQQLYPQPDSWVAGVCTMGSIACIAFAARTWQQGQLLRNTPLARLRSASHGFLKVRGIAEPTFGVITSQVGNISGVYVSELSERYVRRTEQYYDAQSKRWRTRTVYRWETIYSSAQGVPFTLDDGTGRAVVEVEGAEFLPDHLALFYNYRPVRSFPWFASVGDVRTRIHFIPPNATVTVWARYYEHDLPGTTRDEMRLQYDRFHRCMVVLEGQEGKVYASRTGGGLLLAALGVVMLLGVAFILLHPGTVTEYIQGDWEVTQMATVSTLSIVLFIIGGVLVIWVIAAYNNLVNLRGQAQRAWANVDVVLKQRWDLIPNLVETVKGYAQHERQVLERIAELRSVALGAKDRRERIQAEQEATRLLGNIIVWGEQYPELKANENFLHLQRTLADLEEQIADRRELYNEAATNYNVYHKTFPAVLVAQSVWAEEMPLLEAAPQEREVPKVEF
jgi:LemA protein